MGYDRTAPRHAVSMTSNNDLVRRARRVTSNLSETAETLLAAFVEDAETKATQREETIAAHVAASDAFAAKHGTLAHEFDGL